LGKSPNFIKKFNSKTQEKLKNANLVEKARQVLSLTKLRNTKTYGWNIWLEMRHEGWRQHSRKLVRVKVNQDLRRKIATPQDSWRLCTQDMAMKHRTTHLSENNTLD